MRHGYNNIVWKTLLGDWLSFKASIFIFWYKEIWNDRVLFDCWKQNSSVSVIVYTVIAKTMLHDYYIYIRRKAKVLPSVSCRVNYDNNDITITILQMHLSHVVAEFMASCVIVYLARRRWQPYSFLSINYV